MASVEVAMLSPRVGPQCRGRCAPGWRPHAHFGQARASRHTGPRPAGYRPGAQRPCRRRRSWQRTPDVENGDRHGEKLHFLDLTMRDRQPRCQATLLEVALLSCMRRLDHRMPTGRMRHSCLRAGASAGSMGYGAPAHTVRSGHLTLEQRCHQRPAPVCHRATSRAPPGSQPRPSLASSCCSTVGETNWRTSSPPRVAISRTRVLLMNMYCALGVRKMVSTSGIRWRFMPASWNS